MKENLAFINNHLCVNCFRPTRTYWTCLNASWKTMASDRKIWASKWPRMCWSTEGNCNLVRDQPDWLLCLRVKERKKQTPISWIMFYHLWSWSKCINYSVHFTSLLKRGKDEFHNSQAAYFSFSHPLDLMRSIVPHNCYSSMGGLPSSINLVSIFPFQIND